MGRHSRPEDVEAPLGANEDFPPSQPRQMAPPTPDPLPPTQPHLIAHARRRGQHARPTPYPRGDDDA
jgi:hypothetical protein